MSDFTAFYIGGVTAIWLAPWYIVAAMLFGLAVCFVRELP